MNKSSLSLHPAECVFPGHPDKLSDAIADALVQEAVRRDPRALVGVEVSVHRDQVYVTGRVACPEAQAIDVTTIVRDVYHNAGYDANWRPSAEQVNVISNLCLGPLEDGEAEFRELADDQAICIGYANAIEATNHLPVEQWLAGRITRRLHRLRLDYPELALGPDGKALILVEETPGLGTRNGEGHAIEQTWRLAAFSCSLQQKTASDEVALHRAVRVVLEDELTQAAARLPGLRTEPPGQLTVNGAGAFEVGGPQGDNGLAGKKLVVDAYGPRVPIGGGAWSGKDFFKADRAGGLHARRLAKTVVRLGLAREATATLAWFPGDRSARIVGVVDQDGRRLDQDTLQRHFDLSLKRSGEHFAAVERLADIACWGHFSEAHYPWESVVLI
jgi:S-adenosylmethionine synthetase